MDATKTTACCSPSSEMISDLRPEYVGRALRLQCLTVGWNIVEGIVAVTAAVMAGRVALLGFGIDSFVECASGLAMIWRLRAERQHGLSEAQLEATEHRARRLVAISLFLLAVYVAGDAALTLWRGERPRSLTGGGRSGRSSLTSAYSARLPRPASKLGEAIRYLLDHRVALGRFLESGPVPIDNGAVERLHVRAALTRKNFPVRRVRCGW
jgi:hypothetical protein